MAELFSVAQVWKQPKCPSSNDWIKIWYTHTHKKAIKKMNEILSPVAT